MEREIPTAQFERPLFASLAELGDRFRAGHLDDLNREPVLGQGGRALRFAAQTPELLADGFHYEERIAEHGVIATREGNPHDLFNAWVWLRHTSLKRAMNSRQVADIARVGRKQRTRGQCALTHFDEAGAVVWIAGADLLAAWDAHDWQVLFGAHGEAWGTRIAVTVIGHALFEYALVHDAMPVARALAVVVDRQEIEGRSSNVASIPHWSEAEHSLSAKIASGELLADPQELRPLPLAGIPGWHAGAHSAEFYTTEPCFRPLRSGRRYPPPSTFVAATRPSLVSASA